MENKITLTYETLFDLVRREKGREDLQKMDLAFYTHAQTYFREKIEALRIAQQTQSPFAADEQIKLQRQIENIKLLLKELYERRERKILGLALAKSRTLSPIIDTSALLEEEKPLFTNLCSSLAQQRADVLQKVIQHQSHQLAQESAQPIFSAPPQPLKQQQTVLLSISLLHQVQRFVGRDLEVYGPYEPGNTAIIPKELALILIAKGHAKEIIEKPLQAD